MRIAILGYGKEGKSAKSYFQNQHHDTKIFDNFTPETIAKEDFSSFDLVLRSPSLKPHNGWSSMTAYFFEHCPCPIIGITGTKGKGTTCSIITAILKSLGKTVWLVGNIGNPALDVLDKIQPSDIVVYEMSSFQLWDLEKSPHIAVILGIEPDHLNIHKDYADYVAAKSNIAKHQTTQDFCIYNQNNSDSTNIAKQSNGNKIPYPKKDNRQTLDKILDALNIPGQHNRENAEAALCAVAAYFNLELEDLLTQKYDAIYAALQNFEGLPHRLQFLRELNTVKYYDDNFCTNAASLEVALKAFPDAKIILIAGGRDKTANQDLPEIINLMQKYTTKTILMGESGHEITQILTHSNIQVIPADSAGYNNHFFLAESLKSAVALSKQLAEDLSKNNPEHHVVVLMSPAAASFDMFENVYDRGAQFQEIVRQL